MWVESKAAGLVGPARIGWVEVKDRGKRIDYAGKTFRSQRGMGFKSNFYEVASHAEYWISGCRKDGRDALYGTEAEVDEDALDEYWLKIRNLPENKGVRRFRAPGKC